ncbi:MAG: cytochrome ubiquinol oxidase subunit I [Limnobacter sp.]|nr:cytochrome ubiquinol oxidase subunit I [Limnobacter sp.]
MSRPPGELSELERVWRRPTGLHTLTVVNNTHIGLLYIGTSMLFFVLAGLLALLMRAQLAVPDNTLVDAPLYNQLFTMHGTVMMFLFAVPVVEAIAVFLLPGMLGARDLPFPRLSAYAYWAYAIGGLAFFATIFFGASPDGGWFMYPPLTSREQSPGIGADFWLLGIGFIEISAIAGAIELIIGVLMTRAPGMTLGRMPIFAWAMLVVGLMIVIAFPAVIAGTALLELERAFDWPFFLPDRGGDPLLWQHLFWFFGHPEVYIIFLPAAGLVSMMVPVLARTRLVGHGPVVAALALIGLLSFALWAHHMFTAGLDPFALAFVSAASLVIAIPSGVQVFAWIATVWRGRIAASAPARFLWGFLFIFVFGGLTGVMVAVLPFDWQVHDTYFVVAHFHYVLIGGMVFPLFAAFYYWAPLVNGHMLSERSAKRVFWLMFGGFNLAFFPMHVSGLLGMPRRVYTYPAGLGFEPWNLLSTAGAVVLAAGVALFVFDLLRWSLRPQREPGDPWRAPSLEWVGTHSYGIRSIPTVDSRYPLWDTPQLAKEIEAGQHWLPAVVTGGRETLVTSPRRAELRYLLRVSGPSWLPLAAAAGTAGFFLLLTMELNVAAFAAGVAAIASLIGWLWSQEPGPGLPATADIGGVVLPVGAWGPRAHSWWAMVVLLVVDTTIFLSFGFAHLHVSMQATTCPPPGAAQASDSATLAAVGLALLASALLATMQRALNRPRPASRLLLIALGLAASIATAGSFAALLGGHLDAGLAPRANAWSATVAAMLGFQGLHVAIVSLMAIYLCALWSRRLPQTLSRTSTSNVALFWHFSNVQAVLVAIVPHLVAWGMKS